MNISIELHRMRIGIFSSNRPPKCIKISSKHPFMFLITFLFSKFTIFLKNSLTLNPNVFILLLELVASISVSIDPLFNALASLMVVIYAINALQFLLIQSLYISTIIVQICYNIFAFSIQFSTPELFLKFFLYKYLELLRHGDIEPHPGPPFPFKFIHGVK